MRFILFFKQIEIKRKCFIFKTLFWAEYTQTFTYSFIKKTSSFNANQETSISASIIRLWTWTSHIIIILHILSTSYTVPIKEMLNKLTLSFGFLCRLHKLILSVMSWKVCLVYILSHVVTQSIIWIYTPWSSIVKLTWLIKVIYLCSNYLSNFVLLISQVINDSLYIEYLISGMYMCIVCCPMYPDIKEWGRRKTFQCEREITFKSRIKCTFNKKCYTLFDMLFIFLNICMQTKTSENNNSSWPF